MLLLNFMKKLGALFFILASIPIISAASGISNVVSAVSDLCAGMTSLLPVAAMLLTVLGAVIYASGQVMGAETRARANVWATAAVTGAMMAVVISIVTPSVMETIYGQSISCGGSGGVSGGSGCVPATATCSGNNGICSYNTCTQHCCCVNRQNNVCVPLATSCSTINCN